MAEPQADPSDPTVRARLRAGIEALRAGDREGARASFRAVADTQPENENAWIGLALSSDSAREAAAALVAAEQVNPASRFIGPAETDLAARLPGFAEALQAARGPMAVAPPVEPAVPAPNEPPVAEAPRPAERAVQIGGRRGGRAGGWAGRAALTVGVWVLALALIAAVGLGLADSGILRPAEPTAAPTPVPTMPPPAVSTATPPPPRPATTPPTPHVPPTFSPTPTAAAGSSGVAPAVAAGATSGADSGRAEAIAAVQAGRYADAIPVLEAVTERAPSDAEALYYLGIAYLNAPGRLQGAADATLTFQSVQALLPDWSPGLDMLARSLIAQGQYTAAVTPAYEAVKNDGSRAEYWLTLGRAYEGAGASAEAATAYAQAAAHAATPLPGAPTGTPAASPTPGEPTGTPTSTPTPGGPTDTPTASATPGGPTGTPTSPATPGGPTATPTGTSGPVLLLPTLTATAGAPDTATPGAASPTEAPSPTATLGGGAR